MNRHLLDRITPDKKDYFLVAASDLYGWNKTVDNGMSFVFEALKLDTLQQELIKSLVIHAIFLGQEKEDLLHAFKLDNDDVKYVQEGWFDLYELKGGKFNA